MDNINFIDFNNPRIPEMFAERAIIRESFSRRGTTYILISYRECIRCSEQRVRLVVTDDTEIANESGRRMCPEELYAGMIVNVVFSSAMTRSIPPQSVAFSIRVVDIGREVAVTEGIITNINYRERTMYVTSLRNFRNVIRFNVENNADILNNRCQRIPFRRLFPGTRVRVTHSIAMTASIPPQSSAFGIRLL